MAADWREPFRRLFRTVPELDRGEKRYGATFVNILFGLVVAEAAIQFSRELVKWWGNGWEAVDEARLAHLLVAITLTVLSWIGYHQSQQYPPFLIKFINIPFFHFILDVSMVVVYYVVVAVAENSDPTTGPLISKSPRPEAILVFAAFALYVLWDLLGYRIFRDPEYSKRLATPRNPETKLGPRRWVTAVFCCATGILAGVIWWVDPVTPASVIASDVILVLVLFLYRLCKQGSDPKVLTRSAATSVKNDSPGT